MVFERMLILVGEGSKQKASKNIAPSFAHALALAPALAATRANRVGPLDSWIAKKQHAGLKKVNLFIECA